MTGASIDQGMKSYSNCSPLSPDPAHGVQIVIGDLMTSVNGNTKPSQPVTRLAFEDWTKAALFLQLTREAQVHTRSGDLLLREDLCGNIYLRGLRLELPTPSILQSTPATQLRYGYNFASLITNCGRQSAATADDMFRLISLSGTKH